MAECEHWYSLTCHLGNALESVGSAASDAIIGTWAGAILEGLDKALITVGTFWVGVPTPDVAADSSATGWAVESTAWLVVVIACASLLTACGLLVWNQRGAETVKSIVRGFFTLLMVTAAAGTIGQGVIAVSDATASWLIERATGEANGNFAGKLLTVSAITPTGVTVIIIIVMGLIGLLANLVMLLTMYARSAMLILLMAVVPLAAAASMLDWGRQWLRKSVGWFMAFAVFKPTAALIYAIAIKLVEENKQGDIVQSFVLGVMMMLMAALSLPVMINFLVPVAAAAGAAAPRRVEESISTGEVKEASDTKVTSTGPTKE